MKHQNVLVIGGGIAGIQASLDLAERGMKVYLVEKESFIGGKTVLLSKILPLCGRCFKRFHNDKNEKSEKIFANNDCTFCFLEPKLNELMVNKNIEILEYSEVIGLTGNLGNFKVKVFKKSKFVNNNCINCGDCIKACPVNVLNKVNNNLNSKKAIYLPIQQAVPRTATIDKENCIYLTKRECGKCKEFCKPGAIDYEMKDKIMELNVKAIIVAIGFDIYNPSELIEYGYGKYQNIYTAMEYERLTSTSGPTNGELKISPNNNKPKSVAFIQCVGARDLKRNPYCCSVCCMHATKEALLTNEIDHRIKTYIFYTDLRVCKEDFFDYVKHGEKKYDISYIRAKPGEIRENTETKKLTIFYDEKKIVKKLEVDMIILSTALVPTKDSKELANILGIERDRNGFFKIIDKLQFAGDTTRKGIFAAGFCEGPKDIPESIAQASAAAGRAAEVIKIAESEKR